MSNVRIDPDWLWAVASELVALSDDAQRKELVARTTGKFAADHVIEVWGRSIARSYNRGDDWQEISQIVAETITKVLLGLTADHSYLNGGHIASRLFMAAKSEVSRWLDSAAMTIASGMSGISRRYRRAGIARAQLMTEFGREPTTAEIIEFANTQARKTHANPEKDGVLISAADIDGTLLSSLSMDYTPPSPSGANGDDGGDGEGWGRPTSDEARIDVRLTVAHLHTLADSLFGDQAESVKRAFGFWTEIVLDNEAPTARRLALRSRLSERDAIDMMGKIEILLAEIRALED